MLSLTAQSGHCYNFARPRRRVNSYNTLEPWDVRDVEEVAVARYPADREHASAPARSRGRKLDGRAARSPQRARRRRRLAHWCELRSRARWNGDDPRLGSTPEVSTRSIHGVGARVRRSARAVLAEEPSRSTQHGASAARPRAKKRGDTVGYEQMSPDVAASRQPCAARARSVVHAQRRADAGQPADLSRARVLDPAGHERERSRSQAALHARRSAGAARKRRGAASFINLAAFDHRWVDQPSVRRWSCWSGATGAASRCVDYPAAEQHRAQRLARAHRARRLLGLRVRSAARAAAQADAARGHGASGSKLLGEHGRLLQP